MMLKRLVNIYFVNSVIKRVGKTIIVILPTRLSNSY